MTSPLAITKSLFTTLLGHYETLIPAELRELDRFRYADAPRRFSLNEGGEEMKRDDVVTLVEWKLKHGKFRPTLLSHIYTNDPSHVSQTIQAALSIYDPRSPTPALRHLASLKGVGPATASLLLAVHDPHRIPFFSDEAFLWLCRGGDAGSKMRYSWKEHEELRSRVDELRERLGVSALDVERVAYVLMRRPELGHQEESGSIGEGEKEEWKRETPGESKSKGPSKIKQKDEQGLKRAPVESRLKEPSKRKTLESKPKESSKKGERDEQELKKVPGEHHEKEMEREEPTVRRSKRLKR